MVNGVLINWQGPKMSSDTENRTAVQLLNINFRIRPAYAVFPMLSRRSTRNHEGEGQTTGNMRIRPDLKKSGRQLAKKNDNGIIGDCHGGAIEES